MIRGDGENSVILPGNAVTLYLRVQNDGINTDAIAFVLRGRGWQITPQKH